MTFEVTSPGGHGAYVHRNEGAIRTAVRLIQKLLTLEVIRGEGMNPDLRRYLDRDDVRQVANQIMGDGAADSKCTDGQVGYMLTCLSADFRHACAYGEHRNHSRRCESQCHPVLLPV